MLRKLLLAATCLMSTTAAKAEWQEASSRHFVVYSDDDADDLLLYAQKLERFDKALRLLRNVPDRAIGPSSRLTVFVVKDTEAVHQLFGKGGKFVDGFYDPRASGSVAFVPRETDKKSSFSLGAQPIFLHEYSHHFMFANWGQAAFPFWYIEGFAEFHATAQFRSDGSILFGAPPLYRAYGVDRATLMTANQMLLPNPGKMSDDQRAAIYARAWLLTHYLTLDADRRKLLAAYVGAINDGKPADQLTNMFGDPNALDFKLNSYVKRPSFSSIVVPADKLGTPEVKIRALTPGEVATMSARIRSQRGVDTAGAKQVLAMARAGAGRFPNDASAQNVLAEAEFDAGNDAETMAATDRALSTDPKSIHALLYKGMALERIATKAGSTDAAQWLAIRKLYLAANKVDPEDPQPLIKFYWSFAGEKRQPTSNAQAGLLYAYQLAPFDLGLRLAAARLFLEQNKLDEARIALKPVAYNPHGEEIGILAQKALTAIDNGGAAAGIAALRAQEAPLANAAKKGADGKDGTEGKNPK